MKKKFIVIMLVCVGFMFASSTKMIDVESLFKEVVSEVKQDPPGTVYGVIENNKDNVIVSTPVGKYTVDKTADGAYSCMGVTAKLKSRKGSKYIIESSLGDYEIDINRCIVTKK